MSEEKRKKTDNVEKYASKNIEDIDFNTNIDANRTFIKTKRYLLEAIKITNAKRILANRNKEDCSSALEELKSSLSIALDF